MVDFLYSEIQAGWVVVGSVLGFAFGGCVGIALAVNYSERHHK